MTLTNFGTRPRRAVYTKDRTRAHFEQIWNGCEHLCPYYEDVEDAVYLTDSSEDMQDGGPGCEHGNGDLEEDGPKMGVFVLGLAMRHGGEQN